MKRWQPWLLIIAALVSYALVVAPERLQDRTAEQSGLDMAVVYGIHRWGILLAAGLLILGLWAYARFWRISSSVLGRLLLVLPLAGLVAGVVLVAGHRAPLWPEMNNPRYLTIAEAGFLTDDDMVLAVEVDGRAIAYPSAIVAYHHLVNDSVDGVPYVVTY